MIVQSLEPQLVTERSEIDEAAHGEHKALERQIPVSEVLIAAEFLVRRGPLRNVQVNLGVVDAVGVRAERDHVEQLDPPMRHGGGWRRRVGTAGLFRSFLLCRSI